MHEAQPSALFARDHAPSAIFPVMHERERLASAALNDSKWALRSKLPITMLGRSRGKTGEPLSPLTLENKVHFGALTLNVVEVSQCSLCILAFSLAEPPTCREDHPYNLLQFFRIFSCISVKLSDHAPFV